MKFFNESSILKLDMKRFPKLEYRSIAKNYEKSKNVNTESCKKCEGFCCKTCGCHFSPDDFQEISYKYLKKEIKKGYISIVYISSDQIEQNTGTYILRIRNYGSPIVVLKDSWLGGCVLLTENGCPFPYEKRPSGARLLVPQKDYNPEDFLEPECELNYTLEQCCYEWMPHKKTLYRLAKYFKNRKIKCPEF